MYFIYNYDPRIDTHMGWYGYSVPSASPEPNLCLTHLPFVPFEK